MTESPKFRHILMLEDRKGRRIISLEDESYSIGRDSQNSIVVYDYQVSRIHATLVRKINDDGSSFCYQISDGDFEGNKSTNGLLINGHATDTKELKHGDIIYFATEAKANYYIIATDSGIDLFNPDDLNNITISRSTENADSVKTFTSEHKEQEAHNNQDREELIRLASFPELSPYPIVEIDWQGEITYLNPAASIKFDNIHQQKLEHPILHGLIPESNNKQGNLLLREVKIGSEIFEQYVHYLSEKKLVRSYIFDFTKRKIAEIQLKESEARYRAVVRQTSEGIFLVDATNKRIIEANDAYCKLLGYSNEQIAKLTVYNVISTDITTLNEGFTRILQEKQDYVASYLYRCKTGSLLNLESSVSLINCHGKEIFCFVIRNINTEKPDRENINYTNFHDLVTNLPNQKLFSEYLNLAITKSKTFNYYLMAIIIVEIENLAEIIKNIGQEKGNILLYNFAQGFQSFLSSKELAARWDENKFMALFSELKGPRDPAKIAKKMSANLQQYLSLEEENIEAKLNIGMAIYPVDGANYSSLIDSCLIALEKKTKSMPTNYGIAAFNVSSKSASLLKIENLIANAIKEEQFYLCYQPQVNIKTNQITGVEALLRWQHPELGTVTPKHFLRLTEEIDFMFPLGVWILQTACKQIKIWQDAGLCCSPVGVNLSTRQLQQPNLVSIIRETLRQTGLASNQLELEIRENSLSNQPEIAAETINSLGEMGVRICLDDFGSDNFSWGFLQNLPIHSLKINPSLLSMGQYTPRDSSILSAIMIMSQGFDLRVVAKGVEKLEQVKLLRSLNYKEIQGNLFCRPLTPQETSKFLKQGEYVLVN